MIPWTSALRIYAKQKGHYIVPKKGSEAYDEVKKIQNETEMAEEHAVKRKPKAEKAASKKAAGVKEDLPPAHLDASVVKGKVSRKKAPTGARGAEESLTREGDAVLPAKAHTTPIDDSRKGKATKIIEPEAQPEKVSKKGLTRTGKTVKADTQNFIENKNTGVSAVVTAQLAGQKEEIVKALKVAKKTPKIVTVGSGDKEATIDAMKTDDPAAIEGKAPFSIQSLRNRLLC
jgi:hypothetical protein